MPRSLPCGVVFAAAVQATAVCAMCPSAGSAQSAPPTAGGRPDTAVATLLTPNGDLRLRLTSRALYVGFTALGHRRIQRAVDRAAAARYGTRVPEGTRPEAVDGDEAGPEKPDKPLPVRDVESVRASGDSLLLCFASKPGPGPAAPPCSGWRRLLITGLPVAEAQRFADAVRRARAGAVRRPT